jgi:murein DD-endopeptidase MepM/ murein hydrolase activator NlpD
MGHAVRAGGTPVDFPDDASPGAPVTLEFTGWHRTCTGAVPFTCVAQEDYFSDLDVRLLERGDLCQAVYDDTGFPPVAPGGFQVAHVVTTKSPDYIVGDYDFLAKGRRVYNGVATANAVSLGEGDEFAIGNPDIYDPDGFLQTEFYGVDRAAGLVWPRIRAKSGRWQYSCRLPGVSHDELAECPGLGSMGYKLPFDASDPQWWLGQGNNGTFTHKGSQAYAFDFGAKAGTDILAARAGEVVFVRNDQDGNSYDDPSCTNCKPNMVQIRHEDGTFGSYFHMPQNGVTVVVGQHVERGQVLGQVGNTGYSTGPHVHFHVTPTQWSDSTPVAFEVREPISVKGGWKAGDVQSCVVPASNTKVFSTNTRP